MVIKILGPLVLLAVAQAMPPEYLRRQPTPEEIDIIMNCAQSTGRLPKEQWEFLRETTMVYSNGNNTVQEKMAMFGELLSHHNITSNEKTTRELLGIFIVTDFGGDIEKRTLELAEIVEIEAPEMFADEDIKKMMTHALALPLMLGDKLYKELARMKGIDMAKNAQKRLRSIVLSAEYQKASEMSKQMMLAQPMVCYMNAVAGQDSPLDIPFNYMKRNGMM